MKARGTRAKRGAKYEPTKPESSEPLADARIRPLLERYVAATGAELEDVGDGLVALEIPESDQKAFHNRSRVTIAFTLDALERDPEAAIAVVGSPLVEQLVEAIRLRGSRASYGRIEPDLEPSADAAALTIPVTNGSASTPKVDVGRHRVVRLLARVVVQAGSAVEEHLLESGCYDATTGAAVPGEIAELCGRTTQRAQGAERREVPNGAESQTARSAKRREVPNGAKRREVPPDSEDAGPRLAKARPSAELVSLALADLRTALEPKVEKAREEATRALKSELARIDQYYSSLLADNAGRASTAPDGPTHRAYEAEHARRRAEEERRHQVRAVVHPVQLTEWEVLVQRAEWKLTSRTGNRASIMAERWLNGSGAWVSACPQCGAASPKSLSVCKSGHAACDKCARTCGVCDDAFCWDHGIDACHVDGKPTCTEHARECGSCREPYCTSHEAVCVDGDHPACNECVTACAICSRTVCNEHATLTSSSAPLGSRRLCAECVCLCEGGSNEPVGNDEVTRCSSCEKFVCEHHRSTCDVDQEVHCSKHLRRTDSTRRLVCDAHRDHCAFEPGSILATDEVGPCATCGRQCCEKHSHPCVEDGERHCDQHVALLRGKASVYACKEHHRVCHIDQGAFSPGETVDCPVCGKAACRSHVRSCGWCGRTVCVRDMNAGGRCSTCRQLQVSDDPPDNVLAAAAKVLRDRQRPKQWKLAQDAAHTVVELNLGMTRKVVFVVTHGDSAPVGGRTHSGLGTKALTRGR